MKTKLLFISALGFAMACCKEDPPADLPPLTHEGKNTFGCYIDGVPFVAEVDFTIGGPVAISGSFNESTKLLMIQANRNDGNTSLDAVVFGVNAMDGVGNYQMVVSSSTFKGYLNFQGTACEYYHNLNNKGNVIITFLDMEKKIIAGTFAMTLVNPDCADDTMVITNGRFDFAY